MNQNRAPRPRLLFAALCALALSTALPVQAEIYKWVDASGKTHYTENKDEAGKGKAEQVKIQTQASLASAHSARSWQEQEQESKQRLAKQQMAQPSHTSAPGFRKPSWVGNPTETDNSRCALARDVLNGNAVHSRGAKTDANDKEIAARDISSFCR